jgi:ABC-type multidrug transport system fused ATPase/permease subunit
MMLVNTIIFTAFAVFSFAILSEGWVDGEITAGRLVSFVLLVTYISGTIIFLGRIISHAAKIYGQAEEGLNEVMVPLEILDTESANRLHVSSTGVTWKDVSFDYEGVPVFKDFNLEIPAGQRGGLVGHSGAGKTTFVSLLLRQHDVMKGSILIDNQDIKSVTQDSLREHIAVVPQEPLLFHRSIRENIAYGKPGATDEEIIEVAKKAQAHEFITALPEGYETLVGERGVKLSGGQKQRVAIARAMLKDAPILVLDEATSALDSESEVAIQKALHELMEGKTVIAVAHRLSTLREMDRIIVLDQGVIVEDGSHDELSKAGSVYQRLWEHQAGGFLTDDE